MAKATAICRWISLQPALAAFAENVSGHQGSGHIKPLHWYVACRLVVEGGFLPDDITPRPPFAVSDRDGRYILEHVPNAGSSGERTILGGLKTKDVDVAVTKKSNQTGAESAILLANRQAASGKPERGPFIPSPPLPR